jgi:hypothetical protein
MYYLIVIKIARAVFKTTIIRAREGGGCPLEGLQFLGVPTDKE